MIVHNQDRILAVVIRHDGRQVSLVPMKTGKLAVLRLLAAQFSQEWQPCDCALEATVESFLRHARDHGASKEALAGLERLAQRDRDVVASLF